MEQAGFDITIPSEKERLEIHQIHQELMRAEVSEEAKKFFSELIKSHHNLNAVILGCTELPLAIQQENSILPLIDPIVLQCRAAVDYALNSEKL